MTPTVNCFSKARKMNDSYQITDRRPIADLFRAIAHAPTRWCVKKGIHPNTISYSSMVASFGAMICFVCSGGASLPLILGVGFCFLRLYFNMLDGMVAVAANKATATGEIANEFPDRISDVMIFLGIGFGSLANVHAGYIVALLSLLVAYAGTLGKASGAHRDFSGPMSKPWRMVALAVGVLVHVAAVYWHWSVIEQHALNVTLCFIAIGCVTTIAVRLRRIVAVLENNSAGN